MAVFSPDGRYVAYCSNKSGRQEVYVRPFPEGGFFWQVSTDGGSMPQWSRDGSELFYVQGTALMAAEVSTEGSFRQGSVRRLFEHPAYPRMAWPFPRDTTSRPTGGDLSSLKAWKRTGMSLPSLFTLFGTGSPSSRTAKAGNAKAPPPRLSAERRH